jgi:hypothetical protein
MNATLDPDALRQACQPIARWWRAYLGGIEPDPATLARATARARLLGPVPGPTGRALRYVVSGCPDLDYHKARAAFTQIAAIADGVPPQPRPAPNKPQESPAVQLCLAGMPATVPPKHHTGRP